MRLVIRAVGLLFLLIVGGVGLVLGEAHWEMRAINPELPDTRALESALATQGGPVGISYVNTASQAGAGRNVIHPSYVIEWPDGRIFLIDIGMDYDGALAFGAPMETIIGADPIEPHGSVAEHLWADVPNVEAVAFTHLHIDHTGGIAALCAAADQKVTVFQTELQADKGNHTTSPGQTDIDEAPCASVSKLDDGPVYQFPDYPGLIAIAAGGHTPGSTIYLVQIDDVIWVLSGDISLALDDIRTDTAKPGVYSALIVPESPSRMTELRQWLKSLEGQGYRIIVSHDPQSHEENRLPIYRQ